MGAPATDIYEDYNLEGLFNEYGNTHAEVEASPGGGARRQALVVRRDELWQQYLAAGGQRVGWHFPIDDPRQEDGRSENGIQPPIRLFEHSPFVHVVRFWIGETPRDTDQWEEADTRALRIWQQNQNIPASGAIDRLTWSTLVELGGEGGAAEPAKVREIATHFAGSKLLGPVVLVLEKRQRWMLALDDVPHRTFANQWNLALMATLSYASASHIQSQLDAFGELDYRDNVQLFLGTPKSLRDMSDVAQRHRRECPIAYGHKNRVRPFMRPATRPYEFRFLEHRPTDTQAFMAWNDAHVIIGARGTETQGEALKKDLYTDAQANGDDWPYAGKGPGSGPKVGKVHHGFFTAFERIRDQLTTTLDTALGSGRKPIFICGHSLGGAIATLVASYLRSRKDKVPVQLYTFGQPRVGTAGFAQHYWTAGRAFPYFRTANTLDLVTWVPSLYSCDDANEFGELAKRGLNASSELSAGGGLDLSYERYLARLAAERANSAMIDRFLRETCSEHHDYRHFGVHVSCGTDAELGPYLSEFKQNNGSLRIEDGRIPRLQRLYRWSALEAGYHVVNHMMGDGYLPHLACHFERNARAYQASGNASVPLAAPVLPPAEARLVHRMLQLERENWSPPETAGALLSRMIDDWVASER